MTEARAMGAARRVAADRLHVVGELLIQALLEIHDVWALVVSI